MLNGYLDQVVSNACLLKEIDIQTVTKDDIPFSSPFTVTMKRNDYVQVRVMSVTVKGEQILSPGAWPFGTVEQQAGHFFSGPGDVLQHRVQHVSQAGGVLDGPGGALHPLEADRLLPRGLRDLQEGIIHFILVFIL